MKNTIKILLCLALIASCKKDKETPKGKVTFYQSDYTASTYGLVIDWGKPSTIVATDSVPSCGQAWAGKFITVDLPYGKHTYYLNSFFVENSDTFTIEVNQECQVVKVPKP